MKLASVWTYNGRVEIRSMFGNSGREVKIRRAYRKTYIPSVPVSLRHKVSRDCPCKFFDKYGYYGIRKYDGFDKRQQLKRRRFYDPLPQP